MAERLGAEQNLKNDPPDPISASNRRFPVGRAARTWQIAASRRAIVGWREIFPQRPRKRGEIRHVGNVHVRTATDQVTPRRDPASDQRQFPRSIRFLLVRLLSNAAFQGVLSSRN